MNAYLKISTTKKWFLTLASWFAIVANTINSYGQSTILPSAVLEIGGGDIYYLAGSLSGVFAVIFLPLMGVLAQKNPAIKAKLLLSGLVVGALVFVCRSLAPNMMLIIVANCFHSYTSGCVWVLTYDLIRSMYDDAKKAGTLLGLCASMIQLGGLIGPFIIGIIIDAAGWRLAHLPIIIGFVIAILLCLLGMPKFSKEEKDAMRTDAKFDLRGSIFFFIFAGPLIAGISLGSSAVKFGTPLNTALFVLALIGILLTVYNSKKKQDDAFLPTKILKNRNVTCLTITNFLFQACNQAVTFFIPSYCIYILMSSATEASLTATINCIPSVILGGFVGRLMGKQGTCKWIMGAGSILRIILSLIFIFFLKPTSSLLFVYIMMFLCGIYNSLMAVTYAAAPMLQVPANIRTQANGIIHVGQNMGGGIGVAVFSIFTAKGFEIGLPQAFMVVVGASLVGLVFLAMLKKLTPEEQALEKAAEPKSTEA